MHGVHVSGVGDEGADGEVAVVFDGRDGEAARGGIAGWWDLS